MLERNLYSTLVSSWDKLKNSGKPVCIYGMGDGCEKMLREFALGDIKCSEIFASDDFVRGQQFNGYTVKTFSQLENEYDDFIICLAFGTSLDDVMERIGNISKKHTLVAPDVSVIGEGAFSKELFLEKFHHVQKVYSLLADDLSRITFENCLAYKITGDISYLKKIFTTPDEVYKNILHLDDNETYVDLGAYTGDTIREFLVHTNGRYEKIFALEPNKKNFRKCVKNSLYLDNAFFYNFAAWDSDCEVSFSANAGRQAQVSDKGDLISARSVDSVLRGEKATFIKFDVEGADEKALIGSRKTIAKYSPKLCTALYHRVYDIIDIPLLVNQLNPDYKLYMRQYPYYPAWEINLFAT